MFSRANMIQGVWMRAEEYETKKNTTELGAEDIIENNIDSILFLHPSVIEEELSKLEKECPIYLAKINGIIQNVLIVSDKYFQFAGRLERKNIKYDIPENVLILIGGLDGKYYIKPNGIYYDEDMNVSTDLGYKVIEKDSGKVLLEGEKLHYLGRNIIQIDDYFINKKNIMYHNGTVIVFGETGYFMEDIAVKSQGKIEHHYALYDNDGTIVAVDTKGIDYDKMIEIAFNAPKLPNIDLPKNTILYEKLILDTLKETLKYKYEFYDCEATTLIEMTQYLQPKKLELAIDLYTLEIFEVDYTKYFNHDNEKLQSGPILKRKQTQIKPIDNK